MEKLYTTDIETRKLIKDYGDINIGTTSIQALADNGAMNWFYFRTLSEFAGFIDDHHIRYGEKQKVDDGTIAFALFNGEVVGYCSLPKQATNDYRYMVAIKAGVVDGLS